MNTTELIGLPSLETVEAELRVLEQELARRRWKKDPVLWAQEKLGDHLWSGQVKILESVRDNRKTAAATCHEIGKALALDTLLPTPTGWTSMGAVQVGDQLLDEEGRSTRVTAISDVMIKSCYRVVFDDGSSIVAADDHLWTVLELRRKYINGQDGRTIPWQKKEKKETSKSNSVNDWREHWDQGITLTTHQLAAQPVTKLGARRWRIPTARALQTHEPWPFANLDPYAFGLWLGDGTRIRADMVGDSEDCEFYLTQIPGKIIKERDGLSVVQIAPRSYVDAPSRQLGGKKKITQQMLRCSVEDRLALLQGIMDTDGYVAPINRHCSIGLCNKELADGVAELITSLGWVVRRKERPAKLYGRTVGTCWSVGFTPDVNPFRLPRKAEQWDEQREWAEIAGTRLQRSRRTQRSITAFIRVEDQPVKCVTIDSPRHLYLAGESMIPTHNSYSAGTLAAWWIDVHKPGEAFVVTTAPTAPQVRIILWKEIGRAHSRGNLPGRVNQTEWKMTVGDKDETVGIGRKPSDYEPAAFQGVHAPFVLIIVDEANGVRGQLWDALDSLMANDGSKMLAIGNPDDPSGEFFEASKPHSGFNVIHLSAFDSPNFTGEPLDPGIKRQLIGRTYVEERRRKWANKWKWTPDGSKCVPPPDGKLEDTHPFWQSKVLGQFPVQSSAGTLIPLSWIRDAQYRELKPEPPFELSLDVGASEDGDPSCCGWRRGPVFRVLYSERQPDTMKTTGKLLMHLADRKYGAALAKVDYIGVGRGVVDRAREQGLPVHPISVGEKSTILRCLTCKTEWDSYITDDERCPKCNSDVTMAVFANLLSQLWWAVRELFEHGQIDIDENDEELASELLTVYWEPNSKGQTVVKYADGPSPNRADALMIAYARPPKPVQKDWVTW